MVLLELREELLSEDFFGLPEAFVQADVEWLRCASDSCRSGEPSPLTVGKFEPSRNCATHVCCFVASAWAVSDEHVPLLCEADLGEPGHEDLLGRVEADGLRAVDAEEVRAGVSVVLRGVFRVGPVPTCAQPTPAPTEDL